MTMEIMEKLESIIKDPGQYAAEWTYKYKREALGVFPNYFPVEILDAAGILPLGLWGAPTSITKADSHLPPFICSLVKSDFEMLLKNDLKSLSGAVFPQICDTLQNSESIWRAIAPESFTTRFRISKNSDSKGAKEFVAGETRRIAHEVQKRFKKDFSELDLIEAIMRRNGLRRKVLELMEMFYQGRSMLHPMDFFIALQASHIMDPDHWIEATAPFFTAPAGLEFGGARVILSGMTAAPLWILDALDKVDCTIVGDDIAYASRYYSTLVSDQGDPYEALADFSLTLAPCANLRHSGVYDRAKHIVEKTKKCRADGVIFTRLKFCDPEAFDHPHLKRALDDAGIPSLLIETELSATDTGAVTTRIEAFAEQMEERGAK